MDTPDRPTVTSAASKLRRFGPTGPDVAGTSSRWLFGIFILCLALLVGLRVFFSGLQAELRERSANERARIFVGEEIVRGIQGIEKDLYRMASTPNRAGLQRVGIAIDGQLAKLRHDLRVLDDGGTARRQVQLNLEGRDEMIREATYRPDPDERRHVMELIEIAPLLDQLSEKKTQLEGLLTQGWDYQQSGDRDGFFELHLEIGIFLKHIPPYFERIVENANRLFFDSSDRLRQLEAELHLQSRRLLAVEVSLGILVIVLGTLGGALFLKRIGQANRRLAEALGDMRTARDAAERASRAKSEFVSRMSHELRTPLNAIIGFAELLEAESLSPSHKNYVDRIGGAGRHLMDLINAVLDHAKIEAGGLTLEEIVFDLPAAIEEVRTIFDERASAKGLNFDIQTAPDLPRFMLGDPTRLRQILINLLTNAVKFTERGGVTLEAMPEGGQILFNVRDTGIGMDAAARARLFQPFSQADDSIARKFGGTGLGLTISKDLIEAMGGTVEVESAPGVGSVFRFRLPRRDAPTPANAMATDAGAASPEPEALAGLVRGSVLVVDDNAINRQLTAAMLKRLGVAHDLAENGREAVDRVARQDYALVLMDMEMPEMDGIAATIHIRASEAEQGKGRLPIVAMTANAMREDRERCQAAGMDGYLSKPVRLASLRAEIQRLLKR